MTKQRHYLAADALLYVFAAAVLMAWMNRIDESRDKQDSVCIIQIHFPQRSKDDEIRGKVNTYSSINKSPGKERSSKHKQSNIHPADSSEYRIQKAKLPFPKTIHVQDPDSIALLSLGVKSYVIGNWKKYVHRGGRIRDTSDVLRIYGMSPDQWNAIKHVLEYPISSSRKPVSLIIDVNQASVEEWSKLRGIGSVLSERIVKFRDRLGGFHRIDQVKETYGISDSLFQTFKSSLRISAPPTKLAINDLTREQLAKHPYISWKQASIIVEYRKNHGAFESIDKLKQTQILSEEWLQKMRPYLSFQLLTANLE